MPKGVFIRSEEHKANISKALKGNTNSVGAKRSEETRRKLSESKIGDLNPAKKPGVGKKISESNKGREPWNKGKNDKKIKFNCVICGKEKLGYKLHASKYCSKECSAEGKKGKYNHTWSGGKYKYWRKKALIRDNFTCSECGLQDEEIMQVDHILPRSLYPKLQFDINNLRSICPNCHARKSNKEKRKKVNRK